MSSETIVIPQEWIVPAFDERILGEKANRYSLVIPVINEGERIARQLRTLAGHRFPVDIVVADGGSTDGSLNDALLAETGVNALLTKRGPGRLSAQLRMAYAWCLARGYQGIITVDGNGKDGMDAIPQFISALDEGYDLTQGSRYVPGGIAERTPRDRYLAGRFIHAPLVSWRAGFRFTDTTNGFRAYSARALRDSRVAPFRPVFETYTLLFYLSMRIPELGYKVREVPVARRYPPTGKTPTKISGLAGRFAMFGELWDVFRGRYNP